MNISKVTYSKNGQGKGGLNKLGATQIPDEDFDKLINFRRDASRRLITRRGIVKFGDDPDSKPCTSYFFHKRDDGGGKIALRFSGTKLYKYNEATGVWDELHTGLTEYETGTTKRTRWSCAVMGNVAICGNGVDDNLTVTIPDGVVTALVGQPKCRYFVYMQDRTWGSGEDDNPNTAYYSDVLAASVTNYDDNAIVVGGDEQGKTTTLREAGTFTLCGKQKKVYVIDLAAATVTALNAKNGVRSHRAFLPVGNGHLLFNNEGINTLKIRKDFEGGDAFEAQADSVKVNDILKDISPASYDSNAGFVLDNIEYDQYFFSFDSNGDDIPDKTLIRSSYTTDYAEYTTPAGYDYGIYETDTGTIKYILASAISGQMYELEVGFNDDGKSIDYEIWTKDWDFDLPEVWKDGEMISMFGLKNAGSEVSVMIYLDGVLATSATISDDNLDLTATSIPIGVYPIGVYPISQGSDTLDLYQYAIHIPILAFGGFNRIQIRMRAYGKNIVFTVDKAVMRWNDNVFDIINYNKIA